MVSTSTFISDTVLFIRNQLRDNITDPISSTRPINQQFVFTSYPKDAVVYPIITVMDTGTQDRQRGGMRSNITLVNLSVEIRIWARNMKEKDNLAEQVYNQLRNAQFSTSGSTESNLHDFALQSSVNVDEGGEEGIKSKVMTYQYLFITES